MQVVKAYTIQWILGLGSLLLTLGFATMTEVAEILRSKLV